MSTATQPPQHVALQRLLPINEILGVPNFRGNVLAIQVTRSAKVVIDFPLQDDDLVHAYARMAFLALVT
ncbi:hypothetical protein NMY22_g12178 [Coprinellus aureogranulatus]|nr:hypothetical protein NMY22_g12178 [Coprinellus aureogranulatus]